MASRHGKDGSDRIGSGGLDEVNVGLATGAQHPHEQLVLLEGQPLVQGRRLGRHQLGGGLDRQVVVGVEEEGHRQPLRRRVDHHPVLYALICRIGQHLRHRG